MVQADFEQTDSDVLNSKMATVSGGRDVMELNGVQIEAGDRLKRLYPAVNEEKTPLPRAWSPKEKYGYIGLSQSNLRVHYKGENFQGALRLSFGYAVAVSKLRAPFWGCWSRGQLVSVAATAARGNSWAQTKKSADCDRGRAGWMVRCIGGEQKEKRRQTRGCSPKRKFSC